MGRFGNEFGTNLERGPDMNVYSPNACLTCVFQSGSERSERSSKKRQVETIVMLIHDFFDSDAFNLS